MVLWVERKRCGWTLFFILSYYWSIQYWIVANALDDVTTGGAIVGSSAFEANTNGNTAVGK